MSVANPLLQPQFDIPFDKIQASHVEPGLDQLIENAKLNIDQIINQPSPRTWNNTMAAYDVATEGLDWAITIVRHLESVATTPEMRAAVNISQPKVSAFYSSISLNEGLYKALKDYAATDEASTLTGVRKRYLEKTLDGFRRAGAELGSVGKARLAEIDVELSKLTMKFSENVLDATNDFELVVTDETQLAGLPPSAVAAAKQSAESKGVEGWRFTLQAPSFTAVTNYLDNRQIREKVARGFYSRGTQEDRDNRPIVTHILELRREKANLLSYKNFADMVTADRMAKSGDSALAFIESLQERTRPFWEQENRELEGFRAKLTGGAEGPMQLWDISYFAEKMRAQQMDFNEEELRPYFPLPQVLKGMFEIFGELFGINVLRRENVPVWHPDVESYAIYDRTSGELMGCFYSDMFPRETKRGGAWMDGFSLGRPTANGWTPHLGLICGNMTPPLDGKPALLTHREVETVFHEFGHLLHHCLTRVEVRGLAGTNVAWDFVELPSQILENWCVEEKALNLFARHYETGEPLPNALLKKLQDSKKFRSASAQMRQVSFSTIDLSLHIKYNPEVHGDPITYSSHILADCLPVPLPKGHAMIASFTHLFSSPVGYGAGYYSYKWAELLDADAFSRFHKEGVLNSQTGRAFRDQILSKGNSEEPIQLYQQFMGRQPDPEAMLVRLGLGR